MDQRDITKLDIQIHIYEQDNPSPGLAKITQIDTLDGKSELEPIVDRDLSAFSRFYEKHLNNGPLSKFERAAIKTYLYWKTHPELQK